MNTNQKELITLSFTVTLKMNPSLHSPTQKPSMTRPISVQIPNSSVQHSLNTSLVTPLQAIQLDSSYSVPQVQTILPFIQSFESSVTSSSRSDIPLKNNTTSPVLTANLHPRITPDKNRIMQLTIQYNRLIVLRNQIDTRDATILTKLESIQSLNTQLSRLDTHERSLLATLNLNSDQKSNAKRLDECEKEIERLEDHFQDQKSDLDTSFRRLEIKIISVKKSKQTLML